MEKKRFLRREVLFGTPHWQSSHANAAHFDHNDAADLYGFFYGSEIEEEGPDLFPGLPWSPSKQDHRGLSFVPQSQDAAEIGVG